MKNLVKTINSLREEEQIKVMYNGEEYFIQCLLEFSTGGKSMAMYRKLDYKYDSMNIDKIPTNIFLYTPMICLEIKILLK
jgi:prolyl oligopeptidase PreP (S9A serine peptidase family)